jgi:ABC-type dipeptide/oligopeptide/nickel transport system ATPase subunit
MPGTQPGVDDLERLAARTWRGLEEEHYGDWLLRAGGGFTGRANSVLLVGRPPEPLDRAVTTVTRWYRRRGLRPRAYVPSPGGEEADSALARAGRSRIEDALAAVGLTGFERRAIGTLSGGQMQRALFARLLLQDAPVILLDEPFTAIDAKTTADLLDLVRRWHDERRTVVAVLHDLETVKRIFPETLLIARTPVAWGETGEVLSPENLLKARRMVEAFDPHAHVCAA